MEDLSLLLARRAYEFPTDALKLSALSLAPVQGLITGAFGFQVAVQATPPAMFGPVPNTAPPGLVFQTGSMARDDGSLIPVRFIHIEPQRIVIEATAPSSAIDEAFAALRHAIAHVQLAAGSPINGEPIGVRDYSAYTAKFGFPLERALAPGLAELLVKALGPDAANAGAEMVPTLFWLAQPADEPFAGVGPVPNAELALRVGTAPRGRVYVSGALLDSEAHLAYLEELSALLSAATP